MHPLRKACTCKRDAGIGVECARFPAPFAAALTFAANLVEPGRRTVMARIRRSLKADRLIVADCGRPPCF